MTDTTIPEFDNVQDILDQANETPAYHAILEVWKAILAPAAEEALKKVTPQWANRICTTYREVDFADMGEFKARYFGKIAELEGILLAEIASDDECLNVLETTEDVERNTHHYINVLTDWQKTFLQWELDWDWADVNAPVELAAIAEVHRMFFDANGITTLLDQINFEFTDADRDVLAAELEDLRASQAE